ncbi:MAG: hypothetical protein K2Q06_11735, partial [Parvularculaceae bacterium]|nr:hypothetical protein [Parvularculaceae bacterium]
LCFRNQDAGITAALLGPIWGGALSIAAFRRSKRLLLAAATTAASAWLAARLGWIVYEASVRHALLEEWSLPYTRNFFDFFSNGAVALAAAACVVVSATGSRRAPR